MATTVQPSEIVESGARHHKRVSLPTPDGITEKARIRILWQLAPVRVNRSMRAVRRFIKDHHQARSLNDSSQVEKIMERDTDRHAFRKRTVLAIVTNSIQKKFFSPRLDVFR